MTTTTTASFPLSSLSQTRLFAQAMASALTVCRTGVVLLKGTLGAGKTTLVREIVQQLEGGLEAEVSSPSFTLMNVYETTPPVKHFDLYRLDPFIYDENLDEALDDGNTAVFIEWAERIPPNFLPSDYLDCTINITDEDARMVILTAYGRHSQLLLAGFRQRYEQTL